MPSHRPDKNWEAQPTLFCLDSIVFPPLEELLPPKALRNLAACALIRFQDQRVRLLRATNVAWTDARLEAASKLLAQFDDDGGSADVLCKRVAFALGVPGLSMPTLELHSADVDIWDVRRTATAMVAKEVRASPTAFASAALAAKVREVEASLRSSLKARLAAFRDRLDVEVREAAMREGRLDLSRYNYIVREPRRRWRLQFARTFPVLVDAVVNAKPGSFGHGIRESVDAGVPLVKSLAARFGVSPGALRALVARPVSLIGTQWEARPLTLIRVLDALCAEDRPGDDAESWLQLSRAVAVAEELFRRPIASSPVTLGWIRRAARRGYRGIDDPERLDRAVAEAFPSIDSLRAALVRHLADTHRVESGPGVNELTAKASALVDHQLALLHPRRLVEIARGFSAEYPVHRDALERERRKADGTVYWPLIPHEHLASDGTRRVVPLVSRADIRSEGVRQDLCIQSGTDLNSMARACAAGNTFLVSVRDAVTGRSLSTAEISASRPRGIGEATLHVAQHRGHDNTCPPLPCRRALSEVLAWASGPEGQRHLDEGWRQALMRRHARPASEVEADAIAAARALPAALGESLYTPLVRAMDRDR